MGETTEPLPPEVQKVFESFWAEIVCPNGVWNLDQVKRELHDAWVMIENVPRVYCEITDNMLSKPTYHASDVISVFQERFVPKECELTSEELEALENLLDILDDEWASTGEPQSGSERDVLRKALERINGPADLLEPCAACHRAPHEHSPSISYVEPT